MRGSLVRVVGLGAVCVVFGFAYASSGQQVPEIHSPFPTPVLNAPYTAQRVTTTYQKLADGTQIKHERTDLVARDGLARTVTQTEMLSSSSQGKDRKFSTWTVLDPVTLTETHWCDCNRLATVRHFDPPVPGRERLTRGTLIGLPPGVDVGVGPIHGSADIKREALPAQELMGIHTEGTKAVRTVPAGKEGNDRDLTWTIQSWYSPELKLALFTIVDDPIRGITKYEFRQLQRVEPEPSRFQVPAGYQVRELPMFRGGLLGPPAMTSR